MKTWEAVTNTRGDADAPVHAVRLTDRCKSSNEKGNKNAETSEFQQGVRLFTRLTVGSSEARFAAARVGRGALHVPVARASTHSWTDGQGYRLDDWSSFLMSEFQVMMLNLF